MYTTFIDLTKAFDTVSREGLWKIMAKFGCPPKFIMIVRQFHDGMNARVQDGGAFSEPFPVTNGVKQGCVLAPTLFSIMFSAMLSDAFREETIGVELLYRTDGSVFNSRRMHTKTKVHKDVARDFLFADDCALNASNEADMQKSMNLFSRACEDFGLTISTKKTEVLHQPAPGVPYSEPHITVNDVRLAATEKFTYLGSTISRNVNIDDEVTSRIAKASASFGRLRDKVWERRGLNTKTKLKVYKAVVLPSLLYACETWTVYSRHARQLNAFHMRCLRNILRIKWQDMIPDTDVLQQAETESIYAILMRSQLRWAGHVHRMDDSRLPKRLFYGELENGKRSVGRPKLRYKDSLKASLKLSNIPHVSWENAADDRPVWRAVVHSGVAAYEQKRITDKVNKRLKRKERSACVQSAATSASSSSSSSFLCSHCNRTFRARIGLISHLRTHPPPV